MYGLGLGVMCAYVWVKFGCVLIIAWVDHIANHTAHSHLDQWGCPDKGSKGCPDKGSKWVS